MPVLLQFLGRAGIRLNEMNNMHHADYTPPSDKASHITGYRVYTHPRTGGNTRKTAHANSLSRVLDKLIF